MGIYDREYIRVGRQSSSRLGVVRMWSANTWIIVISVAVFVIDAMLMSSSFVVNVHMGDVWGQGVTVTQREHAVEETFQNRPALHPSQTLAGSLAINLIDQQTKQVIGERRINEMPPLQAFFHFSTAKGFFGLEVWRFIGFQFLHGSVNHLFFNMLGLYFFGGLVEKYLGSKRYLAFYLTCGVFGGVSYLLLNLLGNLLPMKVPGLLINDIYTPLIGASAGVFGVLIASAFIAPNAIVLFMFIIPMKLWQLAYGFVFLAAFNLFMSGHNAGGDAAHIGGAIAGFYFIRHTHLLRDFFDFFDVFSSRSSSKKTGSKKKKERGSFSRRQTPKESEIDRLLAKIATQGLQSLTPAEKRTLRRASESKKK